MATYTSIRSGVSSDTNAATNPWGNAVLPVAGDKIIIAAGHTVTIDNTCSWGDDTSTGIQINGALKASLCCMALIRIHLLIISSIIRRAPVSEA